MLTPLQTRVWFLRRLGRLGYSETARQLGLRRQDVYSIERQVERKLRRIVEESRGAQELLDLTFEARPGIAPLRDRTAMFFYRRGRS